jgi:hypothetical protein
MGIQENYGANHKRRSFRCSELFKHTEITYFTFARIFKTGVHATLLTDPEWLKHYWEHDYGDLVADRLKEGMHLWSALGQKFSKPVYEAKTFFNMDYKVDFIFEHDNFVDLLDLQRMLIMTK